MNAMKQILAALVLAAIACSAATAGKTNAIPKMAVDDRTVFFLQVDGKKGELADATGRFQPAVSGGVLFDDDVFGRCIRFGNGDKNGVSVPDEGKLDFTGGFTLEAWLYLEEKTNPAIAGGTGRSASAGDNLDKMKYVPNRGGTLAVKVGSFAFSIADGKLNNEWMVFPTEPVFTTTNSQYNYFPVDTETFGGCMSLPVDRWVHLAISYDQEMKIIRTWIDGGVDRTRFLVREEDAPVLSDPKSAIQFLGNMKNIRLGAIRWSRGARRIGETPALEIFVHQFPYDNNRLMLVVDHIDRTLCLPLELTLIWERPSGSSSVIKRLSLDSHERRKIFIEGAEAPGWNGALYTLTVKAYAAHRQVFSQAVRVVKVKPDGRVIINKDHSISVDGKRIFPIHIYNVFPEDYALLAEMGFNVIMPRGQNLTWMNIAGDDQGIADARSCLAEARKQKVFLMMMARADVLKSVFALKDSPAFPMWYAFDEPWGNFEKVRESYNMVKLVDPGRPILCTQNNITQFEKTAEGADIIICDPYPLPDVSLRHVVYHTRAAMNAGAGMKPVWTTVCQYSGKHPNVQELRCMLYLAVTAGANGLGIYAWDDRPKKKEGWYTKEHPEDVQVLRTVIREIHSLENILVIPNSARKAVFVPPNSALHAAVKEAGDARYLVVVNDSRREESAELSIEGVADAKGCCLAAGGPSNDIQIVKGKVSLACPPLGAAVYELKAAAATP
jgi:hypothetical protein